MARTKIDWTDEVWNPVWGCSFNCSFCYARKFAKRFGKQVARFNGLSEEETERLVNFQPVFLPKNFERKLKGKRIFVNSMSDTADWEPEWARKVAEKVLSDETDRVYLFLSKRPYEGYRFLYRYLMGKETVFLGISATNSGELLERTEQLKRLIDSGTAVPKCKFFLSLEPFLERLDEKGLKALEFFDWVVVGAQTNPLKLPEKNWVEEVVRQCKFKIPVFLKDNLDRLGLKIKEI